MSFAGGPPGARSFAAAFRVTLVGCTAAEAGELETELRRAGAAAPFEVRHAASAAGTDFPLEVIHAVVYTPASLRRATEADATGIRAATAPGTTRVYLVIPAGAEPPTGKRALDDFIQRTAAGGVNDVAREIIDYFREADELNRRSTRLAMRDMTCLGAYKVLQPLWQCGYIAAALHVLNAGMTVAGRGPWPAFLGDPYVVWAATFLGAFFVVHCAFVIFRNSLFVLRFVKRLDAGFVVPMVCLLLAAAATAFSIITVDISPWRVGGSVLVAAGLYALYLYARRIRAECTSLSDLKAAMAQSGRREMVLNAIGNSPLGSDSFPLLPYRSPTIFISYMHGSEWSSATADAVHRWTSERGSAVFLDRSSIPSGSLWRQALLREVSECGCFIAILDGEAPVTDWVLAESAYATFLRKSIGKPRIMLIARRPGQLASGPFGLLYLDLFAAPPGYCIPGAGLVSADQVELSAELVLQVMGEIPAMSLLGS